METPPSGTEARSTTETLTETGLGGPGQAAPFVLAGASSWSLGIAVAVLGFGLPFILGGRWLSVAVDMVILGLFALSIGALIRQSHMISLGHAAFYGGSAYTVAITVTRWEWDPHVAVLTALLVAAVLAVAVGMVAVRLPGISLAMVTLAFSQGIYVLIVQPSSRPLTGGLDGMPVVADRFLWLDAAGMGGSDFWPVAWGALVIVGAGIAVLRQSRFGVMLEAIRDNEERARFCGMPTWWPRVAVFALSGAVAGLAGALFALHNAYVAPSTAYWLATAFALAAALIGGIGSIAGPVVGAALYIFAQDRFATTGGTTLYVGIAFVVVVVFAPSGLGGLVSRLFGRLRGAAR